MSAPTRPRAFAAVPVPALATLADAIESGRLGAPFPTTALERYTLGLDVAAIHAELSRLTEEQWPPRQIATLLRMLKHEREAVARVRDEVELVWTGPQVQGAASRDTGVVAQELFGAAKSCVLIASYSLWDAGRLFQPLSEKLDRDPAFQVRMFLHVDRREGDNATDSEILRRFLETFRRHHWTGRRLPELYYDPRTLRRPADDHPPTALHAKCIVVDGEVACVTSANFTEAAHGWNIEAGAIIRQPLFAKSLMAQFDRLVEVGALRQITVAG